MAISELKVTWKRQHRTQRQLPRLQHGQGARRKPHRLPARQRAQHDRPDHGHLAKDNANVQRMTNESAGENAYTMFDTDEHLNSSTIEALKQIPSMYRVRVIEVAPAPKACQATTKPIRPRFHQTGAEWASFLTTLK